MAPKYPASESPHDEAFQQELRKSSTPPPPADLLARCLDTIPIGGVSPEVEAWLNHGAHSQVVRVEDQHTSTNGHSYPDIELDEEQPTILPFEEAVPSHTKSVFYKRTRSVKLVAIASLAALVLLTLGMFFLSSEKTQLVEEQVSENSEKLANSEEQNQPESETPEIAPLPEALNPPASLASSEKSSTVNPNESPNSEKALPLLPPLQTVEAKQPQSLEAKIESQLAVGEFAPALSEVEKIEQIEVRDHWLAQIAIAQAETGQLRSSLETLAQVRDDRVRTEVLSGFERQSPFISSNNGSAGGGAEPDFDSLIDLITSTVSPATWDEVGGPGSIQPFATGVYIDALGFLRRKVRDPDNHSLFLEELRQKEHRNHGVIHQAARQSSPLRKVSLSRLEKFIQLRKAAGLPLEESMLYLAGLERIEYLFLYPDTGDLVIAGPAGDWRANEQGQVVNLETGRPVLRLEDLIILLRYFRQTEEPFGCLIKPQQANLVAVQTFLDESSKKEIQPEERDAWIEELRSTLGPQEIEYFGSIDQHTRLAQVLIEADYRMKLVGSGIEPGTVNVPSYLELLEAEYGENPPPMEVLRWWFAMNYQGLFANHAKTAFRFQGDGVAVLSENELLDQDGNRIHTGKSSKLNQTFAANFTREFPQLAEKYAIYADLQNCFDLALVAALIQHHGLTEQIGWYQSYFASADRLQLPKYPVAKSVESVVNYRVVKERTILAQVSGGVRISPAKYISTAAIRRDLSEKADRMRRTSTPVEVPASAWWWD
ncbi:Hypothetical protein PBC10988_6940 [Planctomycetales bacterium 10988]|nr:Hypothetical protein PBC10988_6940 [Planctomycetales bacterium 10988]